MAAYFSCPALLLLPTLQLRCLACCGCVWWTQHWRKLRTLLMLPVFTGLAVVRAYLGLSSVWMVSVISWMCWQQGCLKLCHAVSCQPEDHLIVLQLQQTTLELLARLTRSCYPNHKDTNAIWTLREPSMADKTLPSTCSNFCRHCS